MAAFQLNPAYTPTADQPNAIASLSEGIEAGELFMTLLGATGTGKTFTMAGVNSQLQLEVEPAMRGRVMALYSIVFLGSTPIGGPLTGWLSEAVDPRAGLVLGGLAALGAGVAAWFAFRRWFAADVVAIVK